MNSENLMNILIIGDIVGEQARSVISRYLDLIKIEYKIDFTIANIENASHGKGFTKKIYNELLSFGIDAFTGGNHIYQNKEVLPIFEQFTHLVRPWNLPKGSPGVGNRIFKIKHKNIMLINLIGRVFMNLADCPFQLMQQKISKLQEESDIIIVDMHAEATSEKQAIGWMLEGKVNAVVGTHTHIQTADARILKINSKNPTAYITDIGMVGPQDSIIGMDKKVVIARFINQLPARLEPEKTNAIIFNAIKLTIDINTNKTISIENINKSYKV